MTVAVRATSASISSFRSMYREHYGFVWGAARRLGVQDHQREDVVQETFIVAYRRLDTFDGRSPRAWLYSITRRIASNHRRSERRTIRRRDAVLHSKVATPSRPADAVVVWQALDRFVESLPARKREIFVLSELEGMTGAEVARALGLRPSTTYDAIRALRRRYHAEVVEVPEPQMLRQREQAGRPEATARSWAAFVAALPSPLPALPLATSVPKALALKVAAATGSAAAILTVGWVVVPDTTPSQPVRLGAAALPSDHDVPAVTRHDAPRPATVPPPQESAVVEAPAPAARVRRTVAAPPPAPRSLAKENALLREAAAALAARRPARALELADQHIRDHAGSPLSDVAIALRVESLCALGKRSQALGEARVFLSRRPGSPLAERIESACQPKIAP